jgi:UPF0716 protein FxsA
MLKLLALFTIVPALELFLLLQIGSWLGPLPTLLLVLLTGAVGAWFAKREGLGLLQQLRSDLSMGIPPAERLVEGALVLVGGVLLVTPGVLTDLTGLALVLPWTRRLIAPIVLARLGGMISGGSFKVDVGAPRPASPPDPRGGSTPFRHPVH